MQGDVPAEFALCIRNVARTNMLSFTVPLDIRYKSVDDKDVCLVGVCVHLSHVGGYMKAADVDVVR